MKTAKFSALILALLFSLSARADLPDGLQYKQIKNEIPKSYRLQFRQGLNFLKKGQAYQAGKVFEKLVKEYPDFPVYWAYARSEWSMNDNASARALYFKAFELNDSLPGFLQDYARFTEEVRTDWIVVQRLARALYKSTPAEYPLLFAIDKAADAGKTAEASAFFHQLKSDYPDDARIDVFHAILLSDMGRDSAAVRLAAGAIDAVEDPFQLRMLERILANNGYFVEAARVCEKLSRLARRSADTFDAWGHLEFKQGHYENAAMYYQKSLHREYRLSTLLTLAEIYHLYLNDLAKAAYYSKAALQIDRDLADPYFILAESYRRSGKMDRALQYSEKQLDLLDDHPHPLYYHGKLLYELGRYRDAIPYLEQAVSLSPDVQRYRLILAKTYAGAGFPQKARETYANFLNEPIENLWAEEEDLKEEPPAPR